LTQSYTDSLAVISIGLSILRENAFQIAYIKYMAAVVNYELRGQIENPTLSVDAFSLEEQYNPVKFHPDPI